MKTFEEIQIGEGFYRDLNGKPGGYRYVKASAHYAQVYQGGRSILFDAKEPVLTEEMIGIERLNRPPEGGTPTGCGGARGPNV